MVSAANNQKKDDCVNVLRQKDETKNKKKITGTEIETKTRKLFSDFQTVLASEQEDAVVIPSPNFPKNMAILILFPALYFRPESVLNLDCGGQR